MKTNRKVLTVLVLSTLTAACASNATRQGYSTVVGESNARPASVAPSPVNRYYVLGNNDGYYRPMLPRQQVVSGPDNAEIYNLQKQVQFLQRRLEAMGKPVSEETPEYVPARIKPVAPYRGQEISTVPDALPAPIPRPATTAPAKPYTEKTVAMGKTASADRVARKQAKVATYRPALPELPPLPLEASAEASDDTPKNTEASVSDEAAPAISLPALPPVQVAVRPMQAAYRREEPDSEETALEKAREIMIEAKRRVSALLGIAPTVRTKNIVTGEIAPTTVNRGNIAPTQPTTVPAKEWVVIYRVQDAQVMKRISDQLESLSMTPRNREFIDGDYVIEVGTFTDEWRARARVDFLNEITKVAPELRVRTVMRTAQAGRVDAGGTVY